MNITISVDAKAVLTDLQAMSNQVPFATSKAINRTLEQSQQGIRQHLNTGGYFRLRRKEFVERTIKINREDFATKRKLEGTIRVDPTRDVLAKFEEDREKRPRDGSHIAVPIEAKRNKAEVIPRAQRPKALLAAGKAFLGKTRKGTLAIMARVGRGRGTTLRTLFVLKPRVPIKPELRFRETVTRTADRNWRENMLQAFDDAMRTAK